jgi:VanZ family protein
MRKYFFPIVWMAFIFILSSIPGRALPETPFFGFDKLVHVCLYVVLGFLWARALGCRFILVVVICAVFGLSDETHQLFVPNREFSLLDLSADIVGAFLGVLCLLLLNKYLSDRLKPIVI